MGVPSQPLPTLGQPNSSEDPKIRSVLSELQTILNAGVDETNLLTALVQKLGLNAGAQVGRGKSIIATAEVRTNNNYGLMTTADRVSGVVIPTDGIAFVRYRCTLQETGAATAKLALFLGATQLQASAAGQTVGPINCQGPQIAAPTNTYNLIENAWNAQETPPAPGAYGGDSTTGQLVSPLGASPAMITAAAGTYDFSIQFKGFGGSSLTVKNRALEVWTISF